jgi:hypothetical protein
MSNINLNTSFFACNQNLFAKYVVSMHCFIVKMETLSRKIADVLLDITLSYFVELVNNLV